MTTPIRRARKIPLRTLLIWSFVVIILITAGSVWYVSFINAQSAVNNVAGQLRAQITERIHEHLDTFLATPHQINRQNISLAVRGLLPVDAPEILQIQFLQKVLTHPSITSVYYGNEQGGIVGSGREGAGGGLYTYQTTDFRAGKFEKFSVDSSGNRKSSLAVVDNFDARGRPWYLSAASQGGSAWSPIYILFTGQDMALSASAPYYDAGGQLRGVFSVDIFLSHISDFLKNLSFSPNGQSYILERSGYLVAASTGEALFTRLESTQKLERSLAIESQTPMVRESARVLLDATGDFGKLTTSTQLEYSIDGKRYFLQALPLKEEPGLDWIIVVVAPEEDFMAQINANTQISAAITAIALAAAIGLSIIAANRITARMTRLTILAQGLARGEWADELPAASRITEINTLTDAFNSMGSRLQQTLQNLTQEIHERKAAEAHIRASRQRLALLVEQSPLAVIEINLQFEVISWNREAEQIFGYTQSEAIHQKVTDLIIPQQIRDEMQAIFHNLTQNQGGWRSTNQNVTKDQRSIICEWHNNPLLDDDERVTGIVSIGNDVTARIAADEALKKSLREKDALLRELYHRSKNNMQVISAMLSLQSEYFENEEISLVFREMDNRIRSMSLVHEKLYQSKDLSSINFREYLEDLAHHLLGSYRVNHGAITLRIEAMDFPALIDTAIPCGLILNELITNALKYAFPDGRQGVIAIEVQRSPEGIIHLIVADNGVGVPPGFDFRIQGKMGIQTILAISEHQLQGKVEFKSPPGVSCDIIFSETIFSARI